MKKKEWIYILIFGIIVAGVIVFLPEKDPSIEEIIEEDILNEEGEEQIEIPEEYFDLLREARDLIDEEKYSEAIAVVEDALELHEGFQAYLTLAAVHDFTRDYSAKKDALYEVIYTFGNLDSKYWRSYIDALIQIEIDSDTIMAVYEDGITRIRATVNAVGVNHLIDMYTGYASYLGGNQMYAEAIDYLERALAIDPERSEIYNSEIEYYQGKI